MMKVESPGKIFNSARRGSEETAAYTCFYTFNFKDYQSEGGESFGELQFFNDESLAPQQGITHTHEEDLQIMLLPLAGSLKFCKNDQQEILVKSEQITLVEIKKGEAYTLSNPFEEEWINYLHIGFNVNVSDSGQQAQLQSIAFKQLDELAAFNITKHAEAKPAGYIGIYNGRSEGNYKLQNAGNGIFVYVIKGAFEVQGRLLENRDGLSLWNTQEIEFEALGNNAIIMLLEVKLK
jgi:quercetin 2,3-dioxygenase